MTGQPRQHFSKHPPDSEPTNAPSWALESCTAELPLAISKFYGARGTKSLADPDPRRREGRSAIASGDTDSFYPTA